MTTSRSAAADSLAERVRPLLVPAQLAAVAVLLLPRGVARRPPAPVRAAGGLLLLGGGALAVAGARVLGRDLTPFVDPRAGAALRTAGPYAVSRHPVYTGMLAAAAGWTAIRGHLHGAAATAALAGVFHLKAGLEERRLRERFGPAYDDYARRVPRLLGAPGGRAD
ncbi:MAG: methyltransferase family protein [Kineosporiaceae bacterium]